LREAGISKEQSGSDWTLRESLSESSYRWFSCSISF
jgi:hypothetical protein